MQTSREVKFNPLLPGEIKIGINEIGDPLIYKRINKYNWFILILNLKFHLIKQTHGLLLTFPVTERVGLGCWLNDQLITGSFRIQEAED